MSTILPDFKRLAETVKHDHFYTGVPLETLLTTALKDAFDKGLNYGKRLGYEEGLNLGWVREQEKGRSGIVRHTGQQDA